jgi:tRNA threonylcarbamoyladenosine biosynthesis protein TsaE
MPDSILCRSVGQLDEIAVQLIRKFPDNRVFAFYGNMGAGKTTFIKAICKQLFVRDIVNSPTFAIVNEYLRESGDSIYHFDLYRLKSWQEMLDIGYEDYFYSGHYCLLEWPDKVENLLPDNTVRITIALSAERDQRIITF